MRMTRRVKPPTAAVTMTNTCPWSDAMSDAEGGASRWCQDVGVRWGRSTRRAWTRAGQTGNYGKEENETKGGKLNVKNRFRMIKAERGERK